MNIVWLPKGKRPTHCYQKREMLEDFGFQDVSFLVVVVKVAPFCYFIKIKNVYGEPITFIFQASRRHKQAQNT